MQREDEGEGVVVARVAVEPEGPRRAWGRRERKRHFWFLGREEEVEVLILWTPLFWRPSVLLFELFSGPLGMQLDPECIDLAWLSV